MNYSGFISDNFNRRGFISKESILSQISQEEIFSLVFGHTPVEFDRVVSPLRNDGTPGCWFEYHYDKLRFIDFGNHTVINGIKLCNLDCFDMVQVYFKLPNFYITLEFIYNKMIRGKEREVPLVVNSTVSKEDKPRVKILIESRTFQQKDSHFWSKYGISKNNLVEDRVFPVKKVYTLNTKKGNIISDCFDRAYSYNDFEEGRKKIYFPDREGSKRFLTNCSASDVGGIKSLTSIGSQLIITKSYKDYRVLKNNGKNVVWFQNEGMIPKETIINKLVKHFSEVIVWYDNDEAGITASEKVKLYINSLFPSKAKNLWLPEKALSFGIKDPSDCLHKDKNYFYNFLNTFTK